MVLTSGVDELLISDIVKIDIRLIDLANTVFSYICISVNVSLISSHAFQGSCKQAHMRGQIIHLAVSQFGYKVPLSRRCGETDWVWAYGPTATGH